MKKLNLTKFLILFLFLLLAIVGLTFLAIWVQKSALFGLSFSELVFMILIVLGFCLSCVGILLGLIEMGEKKKRVHD